MNFEAYAKIEEAQREAPGNLERKTRGAMSRIVRDPRLPSGRSGCNSPWRAPIVFQAVWENEHGVSITATLRTNRPRSRWWYADGVTAEQGKYVLVAGATASLATAQRWADAMGGMAGTTAPTLQRGPR